MENATELENDIQLVKSFLNNCVKNYRYALKKFNSADKIFHARKKFIYSQFKTIFFNNFIAENKQCREDF